MAAPAMPPEFDPLVDFDGLWTTALADDYLPDPRFPAAKYECINGRLIVSPTEVGANSWGEIKLARLISPAAEAAGRYVYGTLNLTFHPSKWIEPDLTVLHSLPETDEEDRWVPARLCTMAVEFVSPGSRRQDHVDRPRRCAEGGVPYFMQVEIVRRARQVSVKLLSLADGSYQMVAIAQAGQRFVVAEPFAMDFDPAELLP